MNFSHLGFPGLSSLSNSGGSPGSTWVFSFSGPWSGISLKVDSKLGQLLALLSVISQKSLDIQCFGSLLNMFCPFFDCFNHKGKSGPSHSILPETEVFRNVDFFSQ